MWPKMIESSREGDQQQTNRSRGRIRTRIKLFNTCWLYYVTLITLLTKESHCQELISSAENQITTTTNSNSISATTQNVSSPHDDHRRFSSSAKSLKSGWLWAEEANKEETSPPPGEAPTSGVNAERRAFAVELLKLLHEQYASPAQSSEQQLENRLSIPTVRVQPIGSMMGQLLEAISGDGDIKRLTDWASNSFSITALGELLTQFVVSKLGSVNCAALFRPDKEEQLIPRFLLFNEHYLDVPFELAINPSASECIINGKLDPLRRTIILVHGYLTGYTLVDGITNIKNRLLDINRLTSEQAMQIFLRASRNNGTYVLTDDLQLMVRQQLYNVIIVDWFNGANPTPRSNYIKAAVNAQVVGRLIARFISALIVQCKTPAAKLQIIAHSLGCHVSGFTGKELRAAGHRLAKITHLDPVGLCYGRLFSKPSLRLSPSDAQETQAVHTSLNIFDNPLDGAHSNFLVNGGRDQTGCGGQNEVKNSTTSSVSLLFDPAARFGPCSHLRALALFEGQLSNEPAQCQMVGYRCPSYERFLAGKCGQCDSANSQCRLMSLPPINLPFRKFTFSGSSPPPTSLSLSLAASESLSRQSPSSTSHQPQKPPANVTYTDHIGINSTTTTTKAPSIKKQQQQPYYSILTPAESLQTTATAAPLYGAPSNYAALMKGDEPHRSERRLDGPGASGGVRGKPARFVQVIGKIRADTRAALAEGWTNLVGLREPSTVLADGGDGQLFEEDVGSIKETTTTTTATTTIEPPSNNSTDTPPPPLNETLAKIIESPPAAQRAHHDDFVDQIPLGSQPLPRGSLMSPLYFLGTGALAPYCVNYYQFRVLIAESRLHRVLRNNGLASNKLAPPIGHESLTAAVMGARQKAAQAVGRDMLHLTVKLTDQYGHFFKGFSMLEDARQMGRVFNEPTLAAAATPLPPAFAGMGLAQMGAREPMLELTMLLNTTQTEPVRVSETIISYYFHTIVLADRVEVNYMSNISPEVRARYSTVLCPVAINDRHQLIKYIECHKIAK